MCRSFYQIALNIVTTLRMVLTMNQPKTKTIRQNNQGILGFVSFIFFTFVMSFVVYSETHVTSSTNVISATHISAVKKTVMPIQANRSPPMRMEVALRSTTLKKKRQITINSQTESARTHKTHTMIPSILDFAHDRH